MPIGDLHIEVRFYEVRLGILIKTGRCRFCDHTASRTLVDCRGISCTNRLRRATAIETGLLQNIDNAASTPASPPDQLFVSQVRAALTNVDANLTHPLEVSPHQPAAIAQPQSGTDTPSAVAPIAATPRQQSPIEFNPPAPVEIKSRPVVDAQSAPATSAGVLSPLEQMLRQDPLAGAEEAPRPPLPVGQ